MLYMKYVFRPIPGAKAIVMFAKTPMQKDVRAEIAVVPVIKSRRMTPQDKD
jgi:hypothetical protein